LLWTNAWVYSNFNIKMDLDIKLSSGLGFSIEGQIKQTGKQPHKQKINVKLNIKKQTMRNQQK